MKSQYVQSPDWDTWLLDYPYRKKPLEPCIIITERLELFDWLYRTYILHFLIPKFFYGV
jgi:hypothetical protein